MGRQFDGGALATATLVLGIALLGAPLTAGAEIILQSAGFREIALCAYRPNVEGFDIGLPETVSIDFSTADGQSCIATATASAFGPQADAQANHSGTTNDAGAIVYISYFFAIEPLVANAPDTPISVTTQIVGSAIVQGSPVRFGSASAYVQVDLPDPLGPTGFQTYRATANVCGPDLPLGCTNEVASAELALTLALMLPPGTSLQVNKEAGAGANAGDRDNSVGAQAVVDPSFAITPGFMVDYNGVPTPATELYRIVYGPGVSPVPAPAAGWLGLTAFSLLGLRAWRKKAPASA